MRDPRYTKMAQVITHYSLDVKPSDYIWLNAEIEALPLAEAIYEELIILGAHVKTHIQLPAWESIFYKYAQESQLKFTCPLSLKASEICNKRIRVLGPTNTRNLSHVEPHKQTLVSKANQPILSNVFQRSAAGELEWIVTLCPTAAGAQEANMGTLEYEDFVFRAAHIDEKDPINYLKQTEVKQNKMIAYMQNKKELHFKTSLGTDLRINIEGMKWRNSCGKRNYPDGEVFTGPNLNAADGGANGVVFFSYPAIWHNNIVEGIQLVFEKGKVAHMKATKNASFLKTMLSQDEGASKIGEVALGTNYKIQTFTQNILFDEKIGGTFHIALGMGYPETGNYNKSALHWDMICDLREGGTISVDGEIISKNGQFLFSDWPGM